MSVVNLEPDNTHPIPFDMDDQEASTFAEEVAVAANTVEAQIALGASLDVDAFTEEREKSLIEQVVQNRQTKPLASPNTAFAAAAFLRTYGQQLAMDAAQARSAITNKLMEIANCGDPRYELKALELLGKHSDIGLFTERSEITINYKDPTELENAIKERVKRLLNADIVDVTPIGVDLDDQLGVAGDIAPPLMDGLNAGSAQKATVDDDGSTSAQ